MGLKVKDVVVLIDREQGGPARLADSGLNLHSAFTLTAILKVLVAHKLVSSQVEASVKSFLQDNQTFQGSTSKAPTPAPKPHRSLIRCLSITLLLNGPSIARLENNQMYECGVT